ncbi:MAG: TlpA disulfide reductase family protein [Pseudomonadota bacterium]
MKEYSLVRSFFVVACSCFLGCMPCLDAPAFAQSANNGANVEKVAWNESQGSQQSQSTWGNANSNSNSNSKFNSGGSAWGNSNSTSNSNSNSGNSGSSWGNSNSNANSNSGGSSWGNSKSNSNSGGNGTSSWGNSVSTSGNKQMNVVMPDPLKQISYAEYQKMVSQYRGKVVLVNFFATWCGPCRQEIADLKVLRTKISTDDLIIISVSVDDNKSDLSAMLREQNFNYPTAWASNDLRRAFNIGSIPRVIIYDRQGSIWTDHEGLVPREQFFDIVQKMVNF